MPQFDLVLTVEVSIEADTEAEAMAIVAESYPYRASYGPPATLRQGGAEVDARVIEAFTPAEWGALIG